VANGLAFSPGIGTFTLGGLKGNQNLSLQDTSSGAVILQAGNNNASTTYNGVLSGIGGLAKIGAGTLTLSGANTYSGNTTVSNGTLTVNGSLAAGSAVTVRPGATLAGRGVVNGSVTVQVGGALSPGTNGIGALTLGSLVLGGNLLMDVNDSTNDTVSVRGTLTNSGAGTITVTNLGSALVAGRSFKLFNQLLSNGGALAITPPPGTGLAWSNSLALDGTIAVVSGVATNVPALQFVSSANQLTLIWPLDHTGWRLQSQTSTLNVGLGTNWVTVGGSTATNSMTLPINSANGAVFYRLIYP
jgi:autotransporter-associated beta strand protein